MAERTEKQSTGDAKAPNELRDDQQKEQKEEFQDIQRETDSYLLNMEASCGCELLQKIRADISHSIKPEDVLLCIPKYDSRVLARRDIEQIRRVIDRKGDIAGAECLLDYLERYKGWLPCLLKVLRDPIVSQPHLAYDIENAAELMYKDRKKQDSDVPGRADETYKIDEKTEGADHDTDLPQTTRTFWVPVLETTGRLERMPMMRTVSVTDLTVEEMLTGLTSDKKTYPRRIGPTAHSLETLMNPRPMDLTENTRENLVSQTSVASKKREKNILSKGDTFDLLHEYAKADVSDGHSGVTELSVTSTQTWRTEEPESDDTASTSREVQEDTAASEYTCDMRRSEEGYDENKAESRPTSATENKRQMDVLLVGKTGNGKSSVGNSILFKEAFETNDDMTSYTKETQFDYSEFNDVTFKVVDGPGLGDTDLDMKGAFELVLDAMSDAIAMNAEGYHAILIVVRYGGKFTDEDERTLKTMKNIFGDSFIKDHAILVMTYGDNFYKKAEQSKYTFKEWCERQGGVFKRLLSEVENRIVLFDNMTKDFCARYEQVQRLVEVIEGLSGRGKRYTNEMFERAKESRDQALGGSKRPILRESALREAALITQRFYDINFDNVEEAYKSLIKLRERAQKLIQRIKEQDKSTGVPSLSITFAKKLKKFIEVEIRSLLIITHCGPEIDEWTRIWQNEKEDSDMEKEKEEETKKKKWKPKEQSKHIKYVKKEEEEQEDRTHIQQKEIKRNEQEGNAEREALGKKRTEKDNQLSSKWKEGKQERAAKLMKKEEIRKRMKQKEREEKQQGEFEEDGRQQTLNKTLLTVEETGQREDGRLLEQKDFGETKEEMEIQRVLDENKEGRTKDFEEQKKPLKMERKETEYERVDAATVVKPQEEKNTTMKEANEAEHLQEQERDESGRPMPQLEVIQPEQHVQKGEESTRTAKILKQENDRQEIQREMEKDNKGDEAVEEREHETKQELKSQNELPAKEEWERPGENEQHQKKLTENWELRTTLDTVDHEKINELQGQHVKRAQQVDEGYKSIKGETTTVLANIGKSVRKLLSKTFQWFGDKFNVYKA